MAQELPAIDWPASNFPDKNVLSSAVDIFEQSDQILGHSNDITAERNCGIVTDHAWMVTKCELCDSPHQEELRLVLLDLPRFMRSFHFTQLAS